MSDKQPPKIVPLRRDVHGKLKIRELASFEHVKNAHMVPVTAHEFARLGAEYPIVFVKNSDTGEFQSVALLGLKVGENLFVDGDSWKGVFVPGSIRNHPFVLAPAGQNSDQLVVGLIENSPLVSEEEGNALFSEEGEETDYLKAKKETLVSFLESDKMTKAFVNILAEKELLTSQTVTVNAGKEKINLNGIYIVDEKKLGELSDEDFADFRKRGFLPPLYAQLGSLHQFSKLAKMQAGA
ncbi:SapC family protein [Microbulbifer thermotolerans]|uniref:Multidrug transporter n=1 Tax=Microbulbifer thermotolerans TaxID=252514 RepID=A0A143HJT5_MICTH|nr:SapC family protein [Microbulbifer thermotolerans]AMX01994.1 multidrug transporter [Microbulbifer thermotolerans]MCX2780560.1 SapC family protein [Microbulbifer thermotolerans]MCX2783143.1 SapC family protein [Microbulbifer thermotolerans]MCX2794255.1 SapC family protein [Microbulbifer thermotolerans]MCX2800723.1 SapC family protein [Microbulbifer thermotolerans]